MSDLNSSKHYMVFYWALLIILMVVSFFMITAIRDQWREPIAAHESSIAIQLSTHIASVVYQLQSERGLSAGYFEKEGGKHFTSMLSAQRQLTDSAVHHFQRYLNDHAQESRHWRLDNKLDRLTDRISTLSDTRLLIDKRGTIDYFAFYSELNALALNIITSVLRQGQDNFNLRNAELLIILLKLQEAMGQERGSMNELIATKKPNKQNIQEIRAYIVEQNIQMKYFESYASMQYQALMQDIMEHPQSTELIGMRKAVLNGQPRLNQSSGIHNIENKGRTAADSSLMDAANEATVKTGPYYADRVISAQDWWAKATARIEAVRQVSDTVSDQLFNYMSAVKTHAIHLRIFHISLLIMNFGLMILVSFLLLQRISWDSLNAYLKPLQKIIVVAGRRIVENSTKDVLKTETLGNTTNLLEDSEIVTLVQPNPRSKGDREEICHVGSV